MNKIVRIISTLFLFVTVSANAETIVIKAGHLIDPEDGSVSDNQIIIVEERKIKSVGSDLQIPPEATVIDLSDRYVLPGLVDAHDHLALTYKPEPESNYYYLTTIMDGTPIRAIQAFSTGFQKLASGFTVVRDLGNAGNYADSALRIAIEQGWVPGPTLINSGIIIGGMGGQLWPTPERFDTVYPEYLDADTNDEIVKAIRQNILFGAKVIKIMVDSKPYGYTVDEMKLFVRESAKSGLKVAGHVQTKAGALRAVEAGIWSIEHSSALDDEVHKLMVEKGIWRVGTETPQKDYHPVSDKRWKRTVDGIKNAHENGVKMAFSTDADYFAPGLHRGEITINFLESWKAAEIPAPDVLKIMTINGYKVCDIIEKRGPIKTGFPADIIAVTANPLVDIDALRDVQFVMKDGMVFKQNGIVMPMAFFHSGPEYGWRKR
jgi:imidazolonepropionase-like amidohydrolase